MNACKNTREIAAPCPAVGRRFVVEASNSDPGLHHGPEREALAAHEVLGSRVEVNQRTRWFLGHGLWVEVYCDETRELLAGPFDPDQAAPAYIV